MSIPKPRYFFYAVSACFFCLVFFQGDNGLRLSADDYIRTSSYALTSTPETAIGKSVAAGIKAHPGQSGFYLIAHGKRALKLRLEMIEAATSSLDLQYYSVQDDITGKVLLETILRAADRGVRVRMLVDDITIRKKDMMWKLLNAHPGIELRVFNPLATFNQSLFARVRDMVEGLRRFDKRMHNKLFIADNQLSIIGGRNLGDAYFDSDESFDFHDVDILSVGPITQDASRNFDSYWNSKESYPFSALMPMQMPDSAIAAVRAVLKTYWKKEMEQGLIKPDAPITAQLESGKLPLIWAQGTLAADSVDKIELSDSADSKPAQALTALADNAHHEFIIATSYFVPGKEGVQWLKMLDKRGVKIRILTNSLGSTDVVAVFTGYSKYRKALLENGAQLYELKPIPGRYPPPGRFSRSSRAGLHTKVYIIDRSDIVLGTFNFDPRSTDLNTEIDVVIHSPALAEQLVTMFDHVTSPIYSFHVILNANNRMDLQWITQDQGKEARYDSDPKAGFWRNMEADIFSLLPWEMQL